MVQVRLRREARWVTIGSFGREYDTNGDWGPVVPWESCCSGWSSQLRKSADFAVNLCGCICFGQSGVVAAV
ncbi:MAG: hypothetical protein WCK86_22070 [Planctomycetia bacterium]